MSGRIFKYRHDPDTGRTIKVSADRADELAGGAWGYEISVRVNGKRKSLSGGGFTSQRAAEKARNLRAAEIETEGRTVATRTPSKLPLAKFLTDEWLAAVSGDMKPTTIENYRTLIRCYVEPHVGGVRLDRLTAGQLGELYRTLQDRGGRPRKDGTPRPLSRRTVHHVHRMLTTAMRWAVRHGHLRQAPTDAVEWSTPSTRASQLKYWTPAQVSTFIAATEEDRLRCMWILALNTGLRRGELASLRWSDLDEERSTLMVRRNATVVGYEVVVGTPKTVESDREIELDDVLLARLASHRARQAAEQLKWGAAWAGDRDDPHMFGREDGAALHPQAINRLLKTATRRAGVPWIAVHGLRHTSAVLALRAGVPAKVVQHRLGHSSIAITMDVYSHVIEGMQREASTAISAAMGLA